ncbi:MAG: PAS domain-containing protein, partial [Thermoflexales bacterium]
MTSKTGDGEDIGNALATAPGRPLLQVEKELERLAAVVGIDVTDRLKAEAQLQLSEQFNRSLMDGTADCVKVLDMDGRLLHMNAPGMCAMEIDDFGPLCGLEWEAVWPAEAQGNIRRSVARAAGGEVSSFQAFCPTAKGAPKWWEVTVSPVRDADG